MAPETLKERLGAIDFDLSNRKFKFEINYKINDLASFFIIQIFGTLFCTTSGQFLVILGRCHSFLPHLVPVISTGSIETTVSLRRLQSVESTCQGDAGEHERVHENLVGKAANQRVNQATSPLAGSQYQYLGQGQRPCRAKTLSCCTDIQLQNCTFTSIRLTAFHANCNSPTWQAPESADYEYFFQLYNIHQRIFFFSKLYQGFFVNVKMLFDFINQRKKN